MCCSSSSNINCCFACMLCVRSLSLCVWLIYTFSRTVVAFRFIYTDTVYETECVVYFLIFDNGYHIINVAVPNYRKQIVLSWNILRIFQNGLDIFAFVSHSDGTACDIHKTRAFMNGVRVSLYFYTPETLRCALGRCVHVFVFADVFINASVLCSKIRSDTYHLLWH